MLEFYGVEHNECNISNNIGQKEAWVTLKCFWITFYYNKMDLYFDIGTKQVYNNYWLNKLINSGLLLSLWIIIKKQTA